MGKRILLEKDLLTLRKFQFYLKLCGVYLENKRNYQILGLIVSAISLLAFGLMGYSIYVYFRNMDAIATIAHHAMLVIDVIIAILIYVFKRPKVLRMIDEMRQTHDYESELMAKYTGIVLEKRIKNMDKIFKILVSSSTYMVLNLVVNAYIEQWWTGSKHVLIFPCWFPFDLDIFLYHTMAFILELIIVIFITLMVYGVMTSIYLTFRHMRSEFALLQYALETTADRAEELMNYNAQHGSQMSTYEAYVISIKHCGKHHVEITKYFYDAKDVYSYIYLATFITGLVLCVCVGFAWVSDNTALKIKFVGITLIQIVFLYTLCWYGEDISQKSQDIRLVIYGIPWYAMPRECQSTLRLMMERTLTPLSLISASGHRADLDTFMSMIKASYSYFNMMLAAQTT